MKRLPTALIPRTTTTSSTVGLRRVFTTAAACYHQHCSNPRISLSKRLQNKTSHRTPLLCTTTTTPSIPNPTPSPTRRMSTSTPSTPKVTPLQSSDFQEWERLFRGYIAFYKASLPDEQYRKTFERILDPSRDLYALVLRDAEDEGKLWGIAHYFPHQSPWSEKSVMHFNDLFVDPELRGRGLGRTLMLAVAEEAKKAGCSRLEWATQHGNPARKLYDQLGVCDFVEYRMVF